MSSTRRATDTSVFHQGRYASSSEYEQGLIASMVAKRCSVLEDPADRNLIWGIHFLSHQPGGLKAVAENLVARFGDQLGTEQMTKIGKRAGQKYNADEVKKIRQELPRHLRRRFPLRGEIPRDISNTRFERLASQAEQSRALMAQAEEMINGAPVFEHGRKAELEGKRASERAEARENPSSYSVDDFLALCRADAFDRSTNSRLVDLLRDLCLDPGCPLHSNQPWYFFKLDSALQDYMRDWIAQRAAGVVVTALGKEVHEMIEYTLHSSSMTLLVGNARMGKSFSTRSWCEQHPGQARFIEVPTGNDETSFFRAIARGLGMGNFSQYKAIQLRERVESILLTGDILVCLDEAHRLWPEVNSRYGFPKRINWTMSMANQGVPFCLVATPQFFDRQKLSDQIAGWNSAQLIGRLNSWKVLPEKLEIEDLMAVAKSVLPEADNRTLRRLAVYARTSARYLAAIDAIASRARYDAARAGRTQATAEDVRNAMKENVIPSDSLLLQTLEKFKKSHSQHSPISPAQPQIAMPVPARFAGNGSQTQEVPALCRRNGNLSNLPALIKG